MVKSRQRCIQSTVVIENRARAIYIERRAESLGRDGDIEFFAKKMSIAVMEGVHG